MGKQVQRNEEMLANPDRTRSSTARQNKYNPTIPSKEYKVIPAPLWRGKKSEK